MAPSANRMLVSAVLAAATYSASQLITAFVASPAASTQPVYLRPRGSVALQATDPTQTLHTPYTPYTHPTPYTPVVLEIALYSEALNKAKLELEQKFQESEAGRQGLQARIAELESQLAARADSGTSAMPTSRNSMQSLPQAAAAAIPPPTSINPMQQQQQLQQQLQQQKQQKQQQHQLQQRQERIQRRQQQSLPQAAAAAIPPTHALHTRGGG
ncbi:unnamed protein product, partial [Polarella glacialis]